jgi:hypothetical protein
MRKAIDMDTSRLCVLGLMLAVVAISGCRWYLVDVYDTPNPYTDPEIRRVAVAPFLFSESVVGQHFEFDLRGFESADGRYRHISVDIARQFAQELSQFEGFRVIPPEDVLAAWSQSRRGGRELNPHSGRAAARALCRVLGADAIVVGEIRSFDPYDHPRLELAWELIHAGPVASGADDIVALERRGKAGEHSQRRDEDVLFASSLVIDSREARTGTELRHYARSLDARQTGYADSEEMIRKRAWPLYFRFASWYALQEAFHHERHR